MNVLPQIGRILFAAIFGLFGIMHFMNAGEMAEAMSVPGGSIMVYFTGLALIAAAVSFIIRKYALWAGIGLAAFLLLTTLMVHLKGVMNAGDNEMMMQMSMTNLLKDLALAGAALVIGYTADNSNA